VSTRPKRGAFEALAHRNYRLLWVGQLVSTAGSMMQNAAVLWQVALLVDERSRPMALGLVGLFKFLAIFACALFSGVVADAFDRRKLMLVTTSLLTVLASLLALLTFLGIEQPWPIYLLTSLSSAVGTFDGSARQALVPALVPRVALPSAIALNTILFQAASSAGPALSGHVMAHFGLGWVYVANAISFLAVLGALLAMRDVQPVAAGARAPRCCSTSWRRSSPRPRRCCRSSPPTSCTWARKATATSSPPRPSARCSRARCWPRSRRASCAAARCCSGPCWSTVPRPRSSASRAASRRRTCGWR
jgi:MFS family permease